MKECSGLEEDDQFFKYNFTFSNRVSQSSAGLEKVISEWFSKEGGMARG